MNNILYKSGNGLYVNMTNKCPCACTFCIRNTSDFVGEIDSLWLEREPTVSEIIAQFDNFNLADFDEIVFCGFGEPSERLKEAGEVCKYIRTISNIPIRINTNGLSNLIHGQSTEELFNVFDTVSISLNSPDKEKYLAVTQPCFGEHSFEEMLKFAKNVSNYVENVAFTVVDVIGDDDIELSRALAEKIGIPLRVRTYSA